MKRLWIVIPMLLLVCADARAQDPPRGVLDEIGIDQKLGDRLPLDAVFRDETGAAAELGSFFGERPVVLSLVYYECPMLCSMSLNGLLRGLRAMSFNIGKEFDVVTISFDPKDAPDVAAGKKASYVGQYAREGAENGWHFLTGDSESIRRVTEAVGFRYVWDEPSRQWAHAAGIMILTPQGQISQYLFGIEYSSRDLRLALVRAAEQRIGSLLDRVMLYCYHYDPTTGEYGLVIMNVIRLISVGTVLALGSFIIVMISRDSRLI
jgi:protein SCO1/2